MQILFFSLMYLIPAIIFIFFAGMVYGHNRKSWKHITCSLFFLSSSLWFFGVFTSCLIYPKYFDHIVVYWINGSIAISALLSLHLFLINANMYKTKNGKLFKLLFIPGIIGIATIPFDSWMLKGFDENALDPMFIPGPGLVLLWIVDFAYLAVNLFLAVKEMKKGNQAAKLWFKGMLSFFVWTITMLVGSILLQHTEFDFITFFIPHGSLFWAYAIFLSMAKYDYLSSYEKRYNILFQRSPLGILLMDEEGIVHEASPQVANYLGVSNEELIQHSILTFLNGVDKERFIKAHQTFFQNRIRFTNEEISFVNKKGEETILSFDSDFILLEGKTLQFVMVKDVTEAKNKGKREYYLAYHDILTGLSNRAAFEIKIQELISRKEMFDLVLLDLNKLKQINDTLGHQAGDHAIRYLATILQEAAGTEHHTARLGGDEFVLLLTIDKTESIIKQIRKQLAIPMKLSNSEQMTLSASIGISRYPLDGEIMDELYSVADKRMYEEKHGVKLRK